MTKYPRPTLHFKTLGRYKQAIKLWERPDGGAEMIYTSGRTIYIRHKNDSYQQLYSYSELRYFTTTIEETHALELNIRRWFEYVDGKVKDHPWAEKSPVNKVVVV